MRATFWIKKWRFQFRAASVSSLLTKNFDSDGEVFGSSLVGESLHRWQFKFECFLFGGTKAGAKWQGDKAKAPPVATTWALLGHPTENYPTTWAACPAEAIRL